MEMQTDMRGGGHASLHGAYIKQKSELGNASFDSKRTHAEAESRKYLTTNFYSLRTVEDSTGFNVQVKWCRPQAATAPVVVVVVMSEARSP